MSDAATEHLKYLRKVSAGALIDASVSDRAVDLWEALRSHRMPVPSACTGPDGQMFYSWDRGRHHLEAEIVPDQPVFWFYRDREVREAYWGEDQEVGDPLPPKVVEAFRHFIEA